MASEAAGVRPRERLKGSNIGELVMLGLLATVAVLFIVNVPTTRSFNDLDPGTQFFPRALGVIMIGLALTRAFVVLRTRAEPDGWESPSIVVTVGLWAAIVAYAALWQLGFIPLTIAFVLVVMLLAGVRSIRVLVASAVGYSVVAYLLFDHLLFVPLP